MWDFVAACGQAEDLRAMLRLAVDQLPDLVPCGQSLACIARFEPALCKVTMEVFQRGAPKDAIRACSDHDSEKDPAWNRVDDSTVVYAVDWREARFADREYTRDFIRSLLRVDFASGILVGDDDGMGGMKLCLARLGSGALSQRDGAILLALRPHIVNLYRLHKRGEILPPDRLYAAELAKQSRFLSKREAEVAALLCRRIRVPEIATLLMISPRTVETHLQHIYGKLNVCSRVELVHKLVN